MDDRSHGSLEGVIEQHRQNIGAERLHVCLGPKATPETLKVELERVQGKLAAFDAFPETTQLRAELAQAKDRLRQIGKLGQATVAEIHDEHPATRELRLKVFRLADFFALDLEAAIEFGNAELASQGSQGAAAPVINNPEATP